MSLKERNKLFYCISASLQFQELCPPFTYNKNNILKITEIINHDHDGEEYKTHRHFLHQLYPTFKCLKTPMYLITKVYSTSDCHKRRIWTTLSKSFKPNRAEFSLPPSTTVDKNSLFLDETSQFAKLFRTVNYINYKNTNLLWVCIYFLGSEGVVIRRMINFSAASQNILLVLLRNRK